MKQETTSRRTFLKISSASLASLALGTNLGCSKPLNEDFPITIDNSLIAGHTLFEGGPYQREEGLKRIEEIIVGAGIAGLAAAASSKRERLVFEIGTTAGGSSSAASYKGIQFAQGAHYDLPYPNNYGAEALSFLEGLGIIHFNATLNRWDFVDKKYMVNPQDESRTWGHGGYREDPLPKGEAYDTFRRAIADFEHKLPMPTRLIKAAYRSYDRITFAEWLRTINVTDPQFVQALDYQMRDDYGAPCDTVSALAGLHYYQCRPYFSEDIPHFSPPQGNAYFIDKFLKTLPDETLKLRHVVHKIEEQDNGYLVDVLELENKRITQYHCDRVIYAGHKHALKAIMPQHISRFQGTRYAPWLAVNLVLREFPHKVFWQNEVVGPASAFLGFVNSRAQANKSGEKRTVLTAYLCLTEAQRVELIQAGSNSRPWVNLVLEGVHQALQSRIDHLVEHVFVKIHGHAMPIPTPNYLFKDTNAGLPKTLSFAGVDCHRLPLFFEALDSGLLAANRDA